MMADLDPLLSSDDSGNLRQRWVPTAENLPADWDPDLPYGGKVYLARKKKPDPWYIKAIEAFLVIFVICFAYYAYFYFHHLNFHVTKAYAHLGYPEAQHQTGMRYLHGKGVDQHHDHAMKWFRKAADQGHAYASYNLAVGHMKGHKTNLKPGEAHHLIAHAAQNGIVEAHQVLNDVCVRGGCEN